ncbi:MAG: hypothetical protein NT175_02835 [Bacteroidetes bacterium]|nr:hypothetical protein [Bacteroidota bacterium]
MKEKSKNSEFVEVLKDFIYEIDSLNDTLPMVIAMITVKNEQIEKDFHNFIEKKRIKKETGTIQDSTQKSDEEEDIISLTLRDNIIFEELEKNLVVSRLAYKVIPRSLFVCLISQFDASFNKLIKKIFELYPEKLSSSEKALTYSQIIDFKTLDQVKEYVVEKEIESVLRENHSYHFEWLEKKLGMPLRKDLTVWPSFIELTERRNLFVHNDGLVSNQYITTCRKHSIKLDKNIKVGQTLPLSPDYFQSAYECLYELAVKLTHVIWRKLLPDELENADEALNDICYDLIQEENYKLADILLFFATDILQKHYNEQTLNVFIINKALSKYLANNKKESTEILDKKDWSASNNTFKLAVNVLKEDYNQAFELMELIGDSDIPRHAYQIWPLFKKIREKPDFAKMYKKIFKENYKIIERPSRLTIELIEKKKNKSLANNK